jgi:hypothetical protein
MNIQKVNTHITSKMNSRGVWHRVPMYNTNILEDLAVSLMKEPAIETSNLAPICHYN